MIDYAAIGKIKKTRMISKFMSLRTLLKFTPVRGMESSAEGHKPIVMIVLVC